MSVVDLKTRESLDTRPHPASHSDEFREDVIMYGAMLYQDLRKRLDFASLGVGEAKKRGEHAN